MTTLESLNRTTSKVCLKKWIKYDGECKDALKRIKTYIKNTKNKNN